MRDAEKDADIQKDFPHAIHLLHIPEISHHISREDTSSPVIFGDFFSILAYDPYRR